MKFRWVPNQPEKRNYNTNQSEKCNYNPNQSEKCISQFDYGKNASLSRLGSSFYSQANLSLPAVFMASFSHVVEMREFNRIALNNY